MASNSTTYEVLSWDNPSFCTYIIVVGLLILKMIGLTMLTIWHRFRTKSFISEEDTAFGGEVKVNPEVERVRRAFLNDLENIPIFFASGFCYLWANPPNWLVHTLFYSFLLVRTVHSLVYAVYVVRSIVRQPTRAICFVIGIMIIGYMTIHTAVHVIIVGYLGRK